MSKDCTKINEAVDLGDYCIDFKDQFQFYIEGIVEPKEFENLPSIPFDFGETGEDEFIDYEVKMHFSVSSYTKPVLTLSSKDEAGVNGEPSIILYTGDNVDNDPSSITVDADIDFGKYNALSSIEFSFELINIEGVRITPFYGKIVNTKKSLK